MHQHWRQYRRSVGGNKQKRLYHQDEHRFKESIASNTVLPMLRDVEELLRNLTAIVKTSQNGTPQETKHSKLKIKNFKEAYV
jgi:hypothetical protein